MVAPRDGGRDASGDGSGDGDANERVDICAPATDGLRARDAAGDGLRRPPIGGRASSSLGTTMERGPPLPGAVAPAAEASDAVLRDDARGSDDIAANGSSAGGASLAASPKSKPKLAGLTGDGSGEARTDADAGDGDGDGAGEAAVAAVGVDAIALAAADTGMASACGEAAADVLPLRPREVGV